MKKTVLHAALFALAACGSEAPGSDYLGNSNPIGGGGMGGTGAPSGSPQAMAGTPATTPPVTMPPVTMPPVTMPPNTGGAGASAGMAGMTGMAGMMAMAGASGSAGMQQAGSGGAAGMAGSAGAMAGTTGGGNTMGTVTVEFTTVSYAGEYAPLNYGAVWFEKAGGGFLKTAKRWAGTTHASDLVAWTMASGGWGSIFGGGNTADMMDAMSSATIRTHQKHTVTWNMMDAQKMLVPDGKYMAVLEMSESRARDRMGPLIRMEFTKGPAAQMVMAPNKEGFSGVVLKYEP